MTARWRALWLTLLAVGVLGLAASPAGAQDAGDTRSVNVDFEVGSYDTDINDWPILAVVVSGDLTDAEPVLVELRGASDEILAEAESPSGGSPLRLALASPVPVRQVTSVWVYQQEPIVVTLESVPPPPPPPPSAVSPTTVTVPPTTVAPPTTSPPPTTAPEVEESPPESAALGADVFSSSGGGANGGGLTTSLVVILVMLALIFRAPLFGAFVPRVKG